jgi:hypothetical protein
MAFLDLIHWVFVKETAIGEVPTLCHVLACGPSQDPSELTPQTAPKQRGKKINRKNSFDVNGDAWRLPMIDPSSIFWPIPPPRVATKSHMNKEQIDIDGDILHPITTDWAIMYLFITQRPASPKSQTLMNSNPPPPAAEKLCCLKPDLVIFLLEDIVLKSLGLIPNSLNKPGIMWAVYFYYSFNC